MKILAASDFHGNEYALLELRSKADCDLIVFAGDLTTRGHGLRQSVEFLSRLDKEVIIIPGNNDPVRQLQEYCQEFGLIFLHKAVVKRKGFVFAGIGGGLPTNLFHQPTTITEEEITRS